MFGVRRTWHARAIAIGGVILIHVVVIISIAQRRAEVNTESGSRAMFSPVVTERGKPTEGGVRRTQDPSAPSVDGVAIPDSRWRFPVVEIWPSRAKALEGTQLSSFTNRSATPLQPIEPPAGSSKHAIPITATLRLLRWVRPDYSPEWASAGHEGTAVLELHVDESGRPLEINLLRRTGFPDLDQSALQAARAWTFSPPLNHSQPVRTWAEIEIRFEAD
jgi:periplasmic protein TonB